MALPQSPYLPASYTPVRSSSLFSTAMSSGGGGGAMSYQERARRLLARARAHGSSGSSGGGGAIMHDGHRRPFGGITSPNDGIVDVAYDGTATMATGAAFGAMDASEMGKAFTAYIHGVAHPSTVAFVLGLGLRAANWDKNMPSVRKANNAMLRTMFPVLGYRLGERLVQGSLMAAIKGMAKAPEQKVAAPKPPVKTAGVAGAETPIPGERTST